MHSLIIPRVVFNHPLTPNCPYISFITVRPLVYCSNILITFLPRLSSPAVKISNRFSPIIFHHFLLFTLPPPSPFIYSPRHSNQGPPPSPNSRPLTNAFRQLPRVLSFLPPSSFQYSSTTSSPLTSHQSLNLCFSPFLTYLPTSAPPFHPFLSQHSPPFCFLPFCPSLTPLNSTFRHLSSSFTYVFFSFLPYTSSPFFV